MPSSSNLPPIRQKALAVNLDQSLYGSFAEIGAGQEVVRWFFQAGGAAGTIAKSISAYDMQVSDAIYGNCARYVCRERLESMLEYEQKLNHERLGEERGEDTAFFAFADTVSARNYHGTNECHGWMGIRFQSEPGAPDSQIIIHVGMLDNENALQQDALGMVGVNLVYGASFLHQDPEKLLSSLLDNVGWERIRVDVVNFSGPAFEGVDNRVMTLKLVQLGLTGAAMFGPDGSTLQPNEYLRKKNVLVERGRFRPITHVNLDMLDSALTSFKQREGCEAGQVVPLLEITMHDLAGKNEELDLQDFIARADIIASTGHAVLITDFFRFHTLARFLRRCTTGKIAIAMGLPSVIDLFEERYYERDEGGILEAFGHLFKRNTNLFVYPMRNKDSGSIMTVENIELPDTLQHLFEYLRSRDCIVPLQQTDDGHLDIFSPAVLEKIGLADPEWETMVPTAVAEVIKERELFGYSAKVELEKSELEPA